MLFPQIYEIWSRQQTFTNSCVNFDTSLETCIVNLSFGDPTNKTPQPDYQRALAMSIASMWKQPSHPRLIEAVISDRPFGSHAVSLVSLPAGAHLTSITNHIFVDERTYASVEAPHSRNIDLNSDLFYANHSCEPALEFDTSRWEVRVSRTRALTKGDRLTFFYPSTEYRMAQPFDCHCDSPRCKGRIDGASKMDSEDLKIYWLNEHVEIQLREKDEGKWKTTYHRVDETNRAVNGSVERRF